MTDEDFKEALEDVSFETIWEAVFAAEDIDEYTDIQRIEMVETTAGSLLMVASKLRKDMEIK